MVKCWYHASKEAVGACSNCGKLICAYCHSEISGKSYCQSCAEKICATKPAGDKAATTITPPPEKQTVAPVTQIRDVVQANTLSVPVAQQKATPPVSKATPISSIEKINPVWWLLPIIFSCLGGLVGWLLNKNKAPKRARYILLGGFGMTAVQVLVAVVLVFSSAMLPLSGPKEKNPFNFDSDVNESNISFYTEGDSIITLVYASPFYTGMQPLPGQKTQEYENAWKNKVTEITKESQNIMEAVGRIKPKIVNMRSAFLSYLSVCLSNEQKLQDFTAKAMNQMLKLNAEEVVAEVQYNSSKAVQKLNPYFDSFTNYQQVVHAVHEGGLCMQDVSNILAYSAFATMALETHSSSAIRDANAKLDKDLEALDSLRDDITKIKSSIEKINYGFKQLETGAYYFGLAADDFMKSAMPDLKAKAGNLTPNKYVSQEMVSFVKEYLSFFDSWRAGIREGLDNVNQASLVKISSLRPEGYSLVSPAYAATDEGNYFRAYKSVASSLKTSEDQSTGKVYGLQPNDYLGKGWSAAKTAFHGTQNIVGTVIDWLGTGIYNIERVGLGKYYGDTWQDRFSDILNNSKEVIENYKKGVGGAKTYKSAIEYLDTWENVPQDLIDSTGQGKSPGGRVLGFLGKNTVGLFTTLGKGIFKLADPTSTAGDYISGTLDVVGSCIGGSKVLLPASKVPALGKGIAKEAKLVVDHEITLLKQQALKSEKSRLEKTMLESKLSDIYDLEKGSKALTEQVDNIKQQLVSNVVEGGKEFKQNAISTVNKSWDSVYTQKFDNTFKAIVEVLGTGKDFKGKSGFSAIEYLDNVIANAVDDTTKDLVKNLVDFGKLSPPASTTPPQQKVTPGQGTPAITAFSLKSGQFIQGSGPLAMEVKGANPEGANQFFQGFLTPIFAKVIVNIYGDGNVTTNQTVPVNLESSGVTIPGNATVMIKGKVNNGIAGGTFDISATYTMQKGQQSQPIDVSYAGNFTSTAIALARQDVTITFNGQTRSQALVQMLYGFSKITEGPTSFFGGTGGQSAKPTSDIISNSYISDYKFLISK